MLSRAAERVYWAGRYLERAENTARIVQEYSQLLLDLPSDAGAGWGRLVQIFGVMSTFEGRGHHESEADVIHFLVADPDSTSSVAFSLAAARSNIRNARDLLPQEAWESINELCQRANKELALGVAGQDRFEVLSNIVRNCQQLHGLFIDTMSHGPPFRFLELGRAIERADMTSRMIDVATIHIQEDESLAGRYGSTLWSSVLRSLSGFQMYRQYCHRQVVGSRVIEFLVFDELFPRAISACLASAKGTVNTLPRPSEVSDRLDSASTYLRTACPDRKEASAVSQWMDGVQEQLAAVGEAVSTTWFVPKFDDELPSSAAGQ